METNKEFLTERIATERGVESAGEYVLPDYLGDVKKLLLTRATPTVTGKYKNAESVDISGIVRYDIVYLDAEDVLGSASFNSDFDSSFRTDDTYADSIGRVELGGYTVRLKGPRKLSPRSRVDVGCRILEAKEYRIEGDAFNSDGVISECKTVDVSGAVYGRGEEKEYREELGGIDGAILDEVKVLLAKALPSSITVDRNDDGCEISADILVEALVEVKGEMPHTLSTTVSFIGEVPVDGLDDEMDVIPVLTITKAEATADVTDGGVVITAVVTAIAECIGEDNTRVRLVSDCFSTERGIENVMGEFAFTEHIATLHDEKRIMHELSRDAVGEGVRNILFVGADADVDCESVEESGVKLSGKIRFSGIACQINEEGDLSYDPVRVDVPYENYINHCLHNPGKTTAVPYILVTEPHVELGDGKVTLSATVDTYLSLGEAKSERCVTESHLTDESYDHDQSLITVYYPKKGETLFDVAKRFHTSPSRVARDNELTEEVLSGDGTRGDLSSVTSLLIR